MSRSYILLLLLLFSFPAARAQNLAWQWAKYGPNLGDGHGRSIAADAAGNIYVTGVFYGGMRVDTTTIYGSANSDAYIAKFNSQGDLAWIKWLGGKGKDEGNCIVADKNNNVYWCGSFSDTAYFDQTPIVSKGSSDMFLVKLSAAGDLVWIRTGGNTQADAGNKLTVDASGNILMAGYFSKTMQFENVALTSRGNADAFVAKYRPDGTISWAKDIGGGSSADAGTGIACDAGGGVYLACSFGDFYCYIDTLRVNNSAFGFVNNSILLTKFDSDGHLEWYKMANGQGSSGGGGGYGGGGGSFADITNGLITIDNNDNVYLVGVYENCNLLFSQGTLIGSANAEIFIAKYSSAGSLLWLKKGNPTTTSQFNNQVNGICSRDNHIYLTGTHNGQILVAAYDENGGSGAFETFGTGLYPKEAVDICTAPDNHFCITGAVTTNTYLDNVFVGNLDHNSNMFLGKLHIFPTEVSTVNTKHQAATLYPTPAKRSVNIDFENGVFSSVVVYDVTGQIVARQSIAKNETMKTIDLANAPNGMYIAVLTGDGAEESKKIVIAR